MYRMCWFNRFSPTQPACEADGDYGQPNYIGPHEAFRRAVRWCAVHKHENDILVQGSHLTALQQAKEER